MIDAPAGMWHWKHAGFERIVHQARVRTGLTFPENRRDLAESAILRAMAHLGVGDAATFADRVAVDDEAFAVVLTELTVGETYFFRDPSQWDLIRTIIVPDIIRERGDARGIRAWSAGCASGEEAYTLAITMRESGCVNPVVVGSDLCEHRLARAARGVYTKWSMRGLEDAQRQRYFRESGQYFHLLPEHRDVRFRPVNLAGKEYGAAGQQLAGLDLILCRNVLIYIDAVVVGEIFERLVGSLREGGWLMIAASDPQPPQELPLDVVVTESGLLFRKNSATNRSAYPLEHSVDAPALCDAVPAPVRHVPRPRTPLPPPTSPAVTVGGRAPAPERRDAVDDVAVAVRTARAQANRGEAAAALASVERLLVTHDQNAELYVLHSLLSTEVGHHAVAAESARRALYLDRSLVIAQVALSSALLKGNDPGAADRALRGAEKSLAALGPTELVRAGDGATVASLLNIVRAHRTLLEQRSPRGH